jgi:hypothetical protein
MPSDEMTTEINDETTIESLTTNTIETTTTTLMPTLTTTETTIPTRPITTLALINEAQIHNERTTTTTTKMMNYSYRTKNLSTHHWLQSYHTKTTEQLKFNYFDRSKLDLCDGFYDAITMYKGILFIFKGQVCIFIRIINFFLFSFNLVFLAI